MTNKKEVIIVDYTSEAPLTPEALCEACGITLDVIQELIQHDIIKPQGKTPDQWQFDIIALRRIKTTQRLQRHLEVNLAGAALALDLLDRIETLRHRLELMERHYTSSR